MFVLSISISDNSESSLSRFGNLRFWMLYKQTQNMLTSRSTSKIRPCFDSLNESLESQNFPYDNGFCTGSILDMLMAISLDQILEKVCKES